MTPADLRAWRDARGLSAREAAPLLGVSHRTLEGLEQGRYPKSALWAAMARVIESIAIVEKSTGENDMIDVTLFTRAQAPAFRPERMTTDEFLNAMAILIWDEANFAIWANMQYRTARRIFLGERDLPDRLASPLRAMVDAHRANAAPAKEKAL